MKSRQHKLTARELAQLQRDPRLAALYANYRKYGELNFVEEIILKQLVAEATAGQL